MNYLSIVWDPSLGIDLGFFTVRYYSMMYIFGFIAGYYIMKKIFENENLSTDFMDPLVTYAVAGVLLGARLGHVFFYDWKYYKNHLEEILLPIRNTGNGYEFTGFQGLASHGATIGLFLATLYFWNKFLRGKQSFLWILDRITLSVPIGAGLIRLGNLFNSEIVGKPTGTDSGFIFVKLGENFPRYPAQLYEAIAYFLMLFLMLFLYWKTNLKKYEGMLFGIFFIVLWSIRFFIEFYKQVQNKTDQIRLDETGLNTGQWLSIPFVLGGIVIAVYAVKTYQKKHTI
jgi:prolipoprotein diacylglyceryl transferase